MDLPIITSTLEETKSRFSGAPWFELASECDVLLVGVGGLGSHFAYHMGRLGPHSIHLYDSDRVEDSNLSGQMFGLIDLCYKKVTAGMELIKNYCPSVRVDYDAINFGPEAAINLDTNISVAAVDNMEARLDLFDRSVKHYKSLSRRKRLRELPYLFIDMRVNPDYFVIYCIDLSNKEEIKTYTQEWFPSAEAEEGICSYKQTTYMASMCTSMAVGMIVNRLMGYMSTPLDMPYKLTYDNATLEINKYYV